MMTFDTIAQAFAEWRKTLTVVDRPSREEIFGQGYIAGYSARETVLVKALEAIKAATLNGSVCDDVAWFSTIETLHDFCERTLEAVNRD